MTCLREVPPIAKLGKDPEKTGEITQAGRSDASLNAERNLAEVRIGESSTSSSPSVQVINSRQSTKILLGTRTSSPGSLGKRASDVPPIASPSNPSTSSSSISLNGAYDSEVSTLSVGKQSSDKLPSGGTFTRRCRRPSGSLIPTLGYLEDLERLHSRYSRYPSIEQDLWRQSNFTSTAQPCLPAQLLESRSSTQLSNAANPLNKTTPTEEVEKWKSVDDLSNFNSCCDGEKGLILYDHEIEDDDDYHKPKDDDDLVFKTKLSDCFNRRVIASTIGGICLALGILSLFIVLPVMYFTGVARLQIPGVDYDYWADNGHQKSWSTVNDRNYSLLSNTRSGLIDPDTPETAKTRKSWFDGTSLKLVFSDEFNKNNRTFYPGDDPFWTAPNIWYGATQDLDWYDPDAVTTYGGTLQLRLDRFPNHDLQYRSGMLNSWNQLCFKGGVFEVSLSLPGPAGVPGLVSVNEHVLIFVVLLM